MRLVDADAEVERLKKDYCEECTRKGTYGIFGAACTPCWVMDAIEEFENAPTIEPEVRHGEWHECWHTATVCASICTNCGKAATQSRTIVGQELMTNVRYPLCPNCGAKMNGGADDGKA